MNTNLLKAKIVEHGMNVESFCNKADFVRCTFDRKMTGKSDFTREEIARISHELDLSADEMRNIFFAEDVT